MILNTRLPQTVNPEELPFHYAEMTSRTNVAIFDVLKFKKKSFLYCLHFNILTDLNSNLLNNMIKRLCRDKMQNSDGSFGHKKSYVRGRKEGRAPSAPPPPGSASAEFIDLNKPYVRQDGRTLFHFYH